MAGAYQFNVTYNGFLLLTHGLCFTWGSDFLLSGLGLETYGLIYGRGDIWSIAETCQNVTWTQVNEFV